MSAFIDKIERIPAFGPWVKKWYWKYIVWKTNPIPLIREAVAGKENVSVLVIGANDGVSTDPLYPLMKENPRWRGTFVEPVPYLFEKLKQNYGQEARFTFVNVAVTDDSRPLPFYYVSPEARRVNPGFPHWVEQLGTFDKRIILDCLEQRLAPYIIEMEVQGISLEELLRKTGNDQVDILLIDTEGADWKILRQLDLKRHAPAAIIFENCFLSREDRAAALDFLKGRYHVRDLGKDYFCRLKG